MKRGTFLLNMRRLRHPATLFAGIGILLAFCITASAQDFSNKGKDFWVGYGSHVSMYNGTSGVVNTSGGSQDMVLYFTSDQDANVTVSIPGVGWTRNYTVKANTITVSDPMPKSGTYDARLAKEGVSNLGIHITSNNPVVAYAHIYASSVSGATLLFPTPTLGRDYYVLGFKQESNSSFSYPFCFVIATEDNTTLEITPSVSTQTHAAGVPFPQTLQKGQVLNLLGVLTDPNGGSGNSQTGVDLTGTRIRTVSNGTGGCTKIAVFCGSGKLNIRCSTSGTASADNTIQQIFPASAWGKKYITVPTRNLPNNFFRVMITDPATVVTLNGTPLTGPVNNRYYEFQSSAPGIIESTEPVLVAQFITTANQCGNTAIGSAGDPEMIYLSPVEQTISKITLNSTSYFNITSHFVNVVLKAGGLPSFKLDGNAVAASFTPLPRDPSFVYAQLPVSAGIHNLQSDSGFNAIAYGYGNAESYGYNAGTNVTDLYQYVSVQNQYSKTNLPATCEKVPFRFSLTLPYIPVSISWDFGGNAAISPNAVVTQNAPVPDSTFLLNGRTLYVFKLPANYMFNTIGTYPVKVTVNNPSADGCSGIQLIEYDMQVFAPPTVSWQSTQTGCFTDSVRFTTVPGIAGRNIAKYSWDFGDGTIDSIAAPAKKFATAGTKNVSLQIVTDIGCGATSANPLELSSLPVASFSISDTACAGSAVLIKDNSTIATGRLTRSFWDNGNGTKDTVPANTARRFLYSAAGPYTPSLKAESSTGCVGTAATNTFTVGTYPIVNFILPKVCLSDANAVFTDSSYIADNSAMSYHWKFGDANATKPNPDTSILKNASHRYTAAAVYSVTETVTSDHFCATRLTKPFTVNGAIPVAAFSIDNAASLCSNKELKLVNRSTVDFGAITKLVISWEEPGQLQPPATDEAPAGGKTYAHLYAKSNLQKTAQIKLQAFSGETCMSEKMETVTLHASPTVSFTPLPSFCEGDAAFQVTTAAETGQVAGQLKYEGTGVSSTGLFSPLVSGKGMFPIKALYISTEGCRDSATQPAQVFSMPVLQPMADVIVLEGGTARLQPVFRAIKPSFRWTPAQYLSNDTIASPDVAPPESKQYSLTITETGGCKVARPVTVTVLKNLQVANAFSPNGDGINDTWHIPYLDTYPGCRIDIFNRYGQKVFSSTGYLKEWNGSYNGKPIESGTYYYIIDPGSGRKRMTGSVSILR